MPNSQANKLLKRLPQSERTLVKPLLERRQLDLRAPVYEPNKTIEHVFFPETGVISLVAEVDENPLIEVATVGNEGFVGLPIMHGAKSIPGKAFSQVAGTSLVMTSKSFLQCLQECTTFRSLMNKYAEVLFCQIAQNLACKQSHSVPERCARWILQTHDRMNENRFQLTQEFLGQMLGVRRPAVNFAAAALQKKGIITYVRGIVTVNDRDELEKTSCSCYNRVRQAFSKIIG